MKFEISKQFMKDVEDLSPPTRKKLKRLFEKASVANSFNELPNCKKMKGGENAFRIRIGNYRIGIFINNDIVYFSRILHRKDIYKFFP